jgi:hypothetical protein
VAGRVGAAEGIYDTEALASEYETLRGGESRVWAIAAEPSIDEICVFIQGDVWQYRFKRAWGDCPEGCAYGYW